MKANKIYQWVIALIALIMLQTFSLAAQSQREIDELFRDANSYYYFEDYEEALALYLRVNAMQPSRNLDYRIGVCYLNIPGSRHRAIEYLERAASSTTRRYNENSVREQNAPLDAIFYLGNAYFINNQIEKAEATYNRFISEIRNERSYNMDYFNHQISSLKNSRNLQNFPVNFIRSNMGESVNDRFSNFNPAVSGNGRVMAYTTKRRFQNVVFVSRKVGNEWATPQNITLDLVVDGNCSTLSLSNNGSTLYLFRDDVHDGNIYVSNFIDGKWTPIQKLNQNINTPSYETHACETPDGKKLYLTSNRPGGFGDLDIYVSERTANGDWGPASNLGSKINTNFNENTPFLSADGNLLFFSSEGQNTIGGYDVYFSQLGSDGKWTKPVNLGFPLNTTDDDLFFQPIGNGSSGYMAIFDTDGYGEMDILQFDIFLPKYQRTVVTQTDLVAQKTNIFPKSMVIDTITNPGAALVDISKIDNLQLLDPMRRAKLFFTGKKFDLKEQVKYDVIAKPDIAASTVKDAPEKDKTNEFTDAQKGEVSDASVQGKSPLDLMDGSELADRSSVLDPALVLNFDSLLTVQITAARRNAIADSLRKAELQRDAQNVLEILRSLASDEIKIALQSGFPTASENRTFLTLLQASWLSQKADSLTKQADFIQLMSRFTDIVMAKKGGQSKLQPRSISGAIADEDFFYRIQMLKQKASPSLAFFLDQVIISDPSINSFVALWEYIKLNKWTEFQPFLSEYLQLLTHFGLENFYTLSDLQKEELINENMGSSLLSWAVKGIAGISLIGFIILLILLFKRWRKSR